MSQHLAADRICHLLSPGCFSLTVPPLLFWKSCTISTRIWNTPEHAFCCRLQTESPHIPARGHLWVEMWNPHIHSDVKRIRRNWWCWIPVTFSLVPSLIPFLQLEPFTVVALSWSDLPGCRYRCYSLTIHLPVLAYPYINKLLGVFCKAEDKCNWIEKTSLTKSQAAIRSDDSVHHWEPHLIWWTGEPSSVSLLIDRRTKNDHQWCSISAGGLAPTDKWKQ